MAGLRQPSQFFPFYPNGEKMNRRDMLKTTAAGIVPAVSGAAVNATRGRFDVLRAEGRRRCLRLPPDVLETILGGWATGMRNICLPVFRGLPENMIVEGVSYDSWNRWFLIHVWHESFEPVPDGMETPSLEKNGTEYMVFEKLDTRYGIPK